MVLDFAGAERRAQSPRPMKAACAFVQALQDAGVDVIFGYPGGKVLAIYDALYHSPIRHILVRHEQAAAHAADGYARASGRPGVCLATSGPGATNLVTGIATAAMDSIPLVAFTGNVPRALIGADAFQEADITGITLPITKHNYVVRRASELPRIIKEAFHIATRGRPGPVLVDLPQDVMEETILYSYPERVDVAGFRPTTRGHYRRINEVAQAIAAAKRPLLYIGGGVISSGAHDEVRRLAEKAHLPVVCTLMGLGGFPGNHPLCLGMLGMHGTAYANLAVQSCDLLIAVGARFDDRVTGKLAHFAPHAKIVHIDIDPAEIGKNVRVDIPVVGDVRSVLSELLGKVWEKVEQPWLSQIAAWRQEYPLSYSQAAGEATGTNADMIMPQRLVEEIYRITRGEAVMVSDVGQHQMWLAQYYPFTTPRCHISSGGLGTMGFGLPAAIGAAISRPEREVWCLCGDGGFQMNQQELITASAYNIPVKIVISNNQYLGMVRQWQELFFERRYSHVDLAQNPDFVQLAAAHRVPARRVANLAELPTALAWAQAVEGPALLDVQVAREANVYPMVPAGAALSDMICPDKPL